MYRKYLQLIREEFYKNQKNLLETMRLTTSDAGLVPRLFVAEQLYSPLICT